MKRSGRLRPIRRARKSEKWRRELPARSELVRTLDSLTSEIVLLRGKYCVTCGPRKSRGRKLYNGHLLSRVRLSTRFDIEPDGNCHPQCSPCNIAHEGKPEPFRSYYVRNFGEESLEALERRWHSNEKIDDVELAEQIVRYRAIRDELRRAA